MPLEIKFTLSDDDLDQFRLVVDKIRSEKDNQQTATQIEAAARELISKARDSDLPDFVAERMHKLDVVISMINDEEWQLSGEERHHVLDALAYLCDPADLIPDHIPGLGFLDDVIYAEIVLGDLRNEITLYQEFCSFRSTEEVRRKERGENIKVGREEWLVEKRAALHAEMRKGRLSTAITGRWRKGLRRAP